MKCFPVSLQSQLFNVPGRDSWLIPQFAVLAALVVYYLPLLYPSTAVVAIHDNLDSVIVMRKAAAEWLQSPDSDFRLFLAGHLPVWANSLLIRPSTYLYLIDNVWLAYLLCDVIVRTVALSGCLLLARELRARPWPAALGALCFALATTYTSYGLSIAALPMMTWLLLVISELRAPGKVVGLSALFAIGIDSSLALVGLFFLLLAVPLLRFVFNRKVDRWLTAGLAAYALGVFAGSANVIYAQWFSGIAWHREEFGHATGTDASSLWVFASNVFKLLLPGNSWTAYPWYHVSMPLTIMAAGSAVVCLSENNRRRSLIILFMLCAIGLFYSLTQTPAAKELLTSTGGISRAFQFNRFYTLTSLLVFILWVFASRSNRSVTVFLCAVAALQLGIIGARTPHWQETASVVLGFESPAGAASIKDYYRTAWYEAAREITAGAAVMSLNVDPMIAPFNGIPSIDGYFPMYPLDYKHRFRKVIEQSLPASGKRDYFDKWGSRVYAFHPSDRPQLVDFCAAKALGASYVVSQGPVQSRHLHDIPVPAPGPLRLFAIECSNARS